MNEAITKAEHDAEFLVEDLRAALSKARAVEGLLLLDLVRDAASLLNRVKAFRTAIEQDDESGLR